MIMLSKFLDVISERLKKINYMPIRDERFGEGIRLSGVSYCHHDGLNETFYDTMSSGEVLVTINELTALLCKTFNSEGNIKISIESYIKGYLILTVDIYHDGKVFVPLVN